MTTVHVPILVEPILEGLFAPLRDLSVQEGSQWIVDCTLGGGGHTTAILKKLGENPNWNHHKVLAMDKDPLAVERAQERFKREISEGRLEVVHLSFGQAENLVASRPVIGLMADLGFSSDQLENDDRGLSFQRNGPLDMRLDPSQGETCYELLSRISERDLEIILREYGEERFSKRIASAILDKRRQGKLPTTTQELSQTVVHALPPPARHGRIHAATRTFQALRIEVNHELSELDSLLNHVILKVRPGGRIAILSFHSLEDRRVKERLKDSEFFIRLTKKPIQADNEEISINPRSRSAKLRIAERTTV